MTMRGFQKKYLKGLAHGLKPTVFVGHKGVTPAVIRSVDEALDAHELIKVKFVDFKEKAHKMHFCDQIEQANAAVRVGMIGHIAIFFRSHPDPDKRRIVLPER